MEISISRDGSAPLHEQFLDQMRYLILTDVWTLRDFLLSESE